MLFDAKGQLCRLMCKSFHAKEYFECYKINRCHNPRNRERLQISKERYGECRETCVIEYDTLDLRRWSRKYIPLLITSAP